MLGFFALGLLILFATSTILGIGTEGHLPIAEAQVHKIHFYHPQPRNPNWWIQILGSN